MEFHIRRKAGVVVLAVVLVVAFGSAIFMGVHFADRWFGHGDGPKAQREPVEQLVAAMQDRRWNDAHNQLSIASRATTTPQDIEAWRGREIVSGIIDYWFNVSAAERQNVVVELDGDDGSTVKMPVTV